MADPKRLATLPENPKITSFKTDVIEQQERETIKTRIIKCMYNTFYCMHIYNFYMFRLVSSLNLRL